MASTIDYYKALNQLVNKKLGGYHSAKIILKSIDYQDIMSSYGTDHNQVAQILKRELLWLIELKPDCILICCNSLHKYYDMVKSELPSHIPVIHALDLVAKEIQEGGYHHVLLLATKFTMKDGFFAKKLTDCGIKVTIPNEKERNKMALIHGEVMRNVVTDASRQYFRELILRYKNCDVVVLGCTEYPLVVDQENSMLPLINPVELQAQEAVWFAFA